MQVTRKWIYKNISPDPEHGETFDPYREKTLYPLDYNIQNDPPM